MWRVREQIGCDDRIWQKYTGKNITAAILDTGIYPHPDFAGRIAAFKDFVHDDPKPYDDAGHGTHVAGCLAGDGWISEGRYKGIAPSCRLMAGKVLDKDGEGNIQNMLDGIRWVLDNKEQYAVRILNISIGFENQVSTQKITKLVNAIEEVWKAGILVIVAAGNKGPAARSISPLGMGNHVLTVGCHDMDYHQPGMVLCETYSGRGPSTSAMKKPDIVAPGTNIISTSFRCVRKGRGFEHAYEVKSGTSFATPLVAGAAALLWEKEPGLTQEDIKQRLCYSAVDLNEPWNKQGWGMLNVKRALN